MASDEEELLKKIKSAPAVDSLWGHYKTGMVYYIREVAILESTLEAMVVYAKVKSATNTLITTEGLIFVRPAAEWEDLIFYECNYVRRFKPVEN